MTDSAVRTFHPTNSELPGIHVLSRADRLARLHAEGGVPQDVLNLLTETLRPEQADLMTENVVGEFSLPLSVATNFRVDGLDCLVPMAIEEPSVVAAASKAAKLARAGGGFLTQSNGAVMICQLLLMELPDPLAAQQQILGARDHLLAQLSVSRSVKAAGGGPQDLAVRFLPTTEAGPMLVLHLHFKVGEAMGANIVNSAGEQLAPLVADMTGGRVVTSILSNLATERMASARALIPWYVLDKDKKTAEEVIQGICVADVWAQSDPFRAATHNKGILNGITALAMATGNDWRAVEAGAHAWAAQSGCYRGLTQWTQVNAEEALPAAWLDLSGKRDPRPALMGEISLPLPLGTVGGASGSHPTALGALALLGHPTTGRLSGVGAAVGLAQNLAALLALTREGIQMGHMNLHARQVALNAGIPVGMVPSVVAQMVIERTIHQEAALQFWKEMQAV